MENFNSLDFIIIIIIGLSAIFAFFRGLITEILALATIIIACYITPILLPHVSAFILDLETRFDFSFMGIFEKQFHSVIFFSISLLVCFFITSLANIVITLFLRPYKISIPDRFLGLFFGIARGILIIAIAVIVTDISSETWLKIPDNLQTIRQNSKLLPHFKEITNTLKTFNTDAIPINLESWHKPL